MIKRLRNLWAWSALDPYTLGAETGRALLESVRYVPAEIIYPDKLREFLQVKPDATLDEIVNLEK